MGSANVDLTPRTDGLLPFWLLLIVLGIWLLLIIYAWRGRESRPERVPQHLAMLSLFVANVLFFWRPLFTGAHLPRGGGDLNSFFFSLHAYSAERISSGEFPLWNPHLHGGMPHLGNFQAGLLYPPNLISYIVAQPFSYATLECLAIVHYLIASIGTYLLLRTLGAGRIGAVLGGIVFAYGGFFVAHLGHYSMISSAAWVPWLFWCVLSLVRRRTWNWAAGLAALVFLAATGGHQQTLLFALVGMTLWWLYLQAERAGFRIPGIGVFDNPGANREAFEQVRKPAYATTAAQYIAAAGAGLLLAAPMILPSLQLAGQSVRSTLSFDQASEFSVQPVALLQLLLPTVFGSNPTDYWGAFSSGEIWGYVGVTTLVVVAIGVAFRPSGGRLFFAALAVLSLIYAVGPAAPLHGWFYQFVPGFDLIRAPARAYLFLNLSLAVLAGLAVSDLSRRVAHIGFRQRVILARSIRSLLVVIGVTALFIIPLFYSQILGVHDPSNRPVITVENLWMFVIFLSLLLLVLWLASAGRMRSAALGVGLAVILTLDLFSATMPFNPVDEDLVASYREPEITAFLLEEWEVNSPFRIDVRHPGLLPNFGAIEGLHVATGVYDPMQPAAWTTLHDAVSEDPGSAAYAMVNVEYWILPADTETSPPTPFELVFESNGGNQVWQRRDAMPRAWFTSDVVEAADLVALDALREGALDSAEQIIVAQNVSNADGQADGTVEIVNYEPESIRLQVDVDGAGYVVLSEGYFPGWTATIDGESADIQRASFGMRAIPVDETSREIVVQYEPGFVTLGFLAAGLGGLILLGMILAPFIDRRIGESRTRPSDNDFGPN